VIGEVLKSGDVVIINIPDENWRWGYRPVEKQRGTTATVEGFGEITYSRVQNYGKEPGVYINHAWVKVSGVEKGSVSSCFLELADGEEYERRLAHFREHRDEYDVRLRGLPEMELWEGDIVEMPKGNPWPGSPRLKVSSINYNYLGQMRQDGVTPMPEYTVEPEGGKAGTVAVNASELKLIERGNVWKHFNGEKPVFADLSEEAAFFGMLGQVDEVPNPASGKYKWTLAEVVQAAKDGIVDCMTCDHGFFGTSKEVQHRAQRFRDRELGERVRAKFVKEFENHSLLVQ